MRVVARDVRSRIVSAREGFGDLVVVGIDRLNPTCGFSAQIASRRDSPISSEARGCCFVGMHLAYR